MVGKIVESLNKVNSFSKSIIKYGCYIALFFGIIGMLLINYNNMIAQKVELYTIGSSMIYTGAVFFAQMVIGGLIIDFFNSMVSNNDD